MERFYLQMHITNKCGNRCKHCYQDTYGGEDMTIAQVDGILTELSNMCKKIDVESHVAITGGDPVIANDFFKILMIARNHCDRVGILGNPEMIDKEVIQRFLAIGIDFYQLSLDGIYNTHDDNRYKGSFVKTCDAIKRLSDSGIDTYVNMTLTEQNNLQISRTEAIAKMCGAYYFGSDDCVPKGKDCKRKENCSLGYSAMTILPDLTLMACRRTPSSVLGTWSFKKGLEYHFVHSEKMKKYRAVH